MNSKHFTHPLLAIVLLFASCTPATQKESGDNSATTSGGVWKKQVTRIIDMGEKEDTAVHHLREANQDTTLLELFINAIKAGQITAYSNSDNQFTTKLTVAALNEMTGGRTDTMMVTDPVTGQELTKVVRREFNYDMVH